MSLGWSKNLAVFQRLLRNGQGRPRLSALRLCQPDLRFGILNTRQRRLMILLRYAAAAQQIVGPFLLRFCMFG